MKLLTLTLVVIACVPFASTQTAVQEAKAGPIAREVHRRMLAIYPVVMHDGIECFVLKSSFSAALIYIPTYVSEDYAEMLRTTSPTGKAEDRILPEVEFVSRSPKPDGTVASGAAAILPNQGDSSSKSSAATLPTLVKTEVNVNSNPFLVPTLDQIVSTNSLAYLPVPAIPPKPKEPKPFGLSFWLTTAALFGASVADIESTVSGLNRGCVEANPIFGRHPTRSQMYGLTMGINGAQLFYIMRYKKKNPWSLVELNQLVGTGTHAYAAIHNSRMSCR